VDGDSLFEGTIAKRPFIVTGESVSVSDRQTPVDSKDLLTTIVKCIIVLMRLKVLTVVYWFWNWQGGEFIATDRQMRL